MEENVKATIRIVGETVREAPSSTVWDTLAEALNPQELSKFSIWASAAIQPVAVLPAYKILEAKFQPVGVEVTTS